MFSTIHSHLMIPQQAVVLPSSLFQFTSSELLNFDKCLWWWHSHSTNWFRYSECGVPSTALLAHIKCFTTFRILDLLSQYQLLWALNHIVQRSSRSAERTAHLHSAPREQVWTSGGDSSRYLLCQERWPLIYDTRTMLSVHCRPPGPGTHTPGYPFPHLCHIWPAFFICGSGLAA